MKRIIPATLLLLGACTTAPEPKIITRDVMIAVATPCVAADFPAPPTTKTDAEIAALPSGPARTLAIAERDQIRGQRLSVVEPAIVICQAATPR